MRQSICSKVQIGCKRLLRLRHDELDSWDFVSSSSILPSYQKAGDSLLNIIAAILLFGIIVLIHELGHFIFAKLNGIGVVEFSIGMGPRILGRKFGETVYSLKLLPFGGSCMMVGEDADCSDEGAFNSKPVLARISVIAAGPGFNFLLAFLAGMVIVAQVGHDGAVMTGVMDGYPAAQAGLREGDRIIKINRRKVVSHRDISLYLFTHPGETVTLLYERPVGGSFENGGAAERRQARLTPIYDPDYQSYMLGVVFSGYEKAEDLMDFLNYSLYEVKYCIISTLDSFGMLFRRQIKPEEAVAGPVQIVSMVGETVGESREGGLPALVYVLANWILLLSTSLGVMNLLPVPALDGGRLFFLLIELVRGRPVDPEKEGFVHMIGMCFLMTVMIFILVNDIRKLV